MILLLNGVEGIEFIEIRSGGKSDSICAMTVNWRGSIKRCCWKAFVSKWIKSFLERIGTLGYYNGQSSIFFSGGRCQPQSRGWRRIAGVKGYPIDVKLSFASFFFAVVGSVFFLLLFSIHPQHWHSQRVDTGMNRTIRLKTK